MKLYISDFYPEFYLVYPDGKHYILTNYAADYTVHMYNWPQFYGKSWCKEHIHDLTDVTVRDLENYILYGSSHKKHPL